MVDKDIFSSKSYYPCSARDLYDWHSRDGALERLIPPWENTSVVSKSGGIAVGGKVTMKMHAGPIPFSWEAHHVEDVPGSMFRDIQYKGPFAAWSHSHFFKDTDQGAELEDRIEYALPAHKFLPGFVKSHMNKTLRRIFSYRQQTLKEDLLIHERCSKKSLNILISGASGVLGRALVPFLTTGGHNVWTLVRGEANGVKNEIYWNPEKEDIDIEALPEVDAVIHLAGEYIGLGRWTEEKKRKIIESRTKGTQLLAETMATMKRPPAVFLSASAVGYYGDSGSECVEEERIQGDDFISEVCYLWEKSTSPASQAGIRTVLMRIGVVLTPKGGALQKFIGSSHLGLISRIGSGKQYLSWLSIDDMISSILHAVTCEELEGPVNFAAPYPVTNIEMLQTLSRIIHRPLMPTIPVAVIKSIYGQMASEILLSGCRVEGNKLQESGYIFRHPKLQQALLNLLGKHMIK